MVVTLEEMKNYLRVDYDDDDSLIGHLLQSAEKICMDIIRTDDRSVLEKDENAKTAVLYAVHPHIHQQVQYKVLIHSKIPPFLGDAYYL